MLEAFGNMINSESSDAGVEKNSKRLVKLNLSIMSLHVSHEPNPANKGQKDMTAHSQSNIDMIWVAP
jgi:hypothetical protein